MKLYSGDTHRRALKSSNSPEMKCQENGYRREEKTKRKIKNDNLFVHERVNIYKESKKNQILIMAAMSG